MCKHIALSRKIDPEHGTRQYLGYRSFRYDLTFLRHSPNIFKCTCGSRWIDPLRSVDVSVNTISTTNLPTHYRERVHPLATGAADRARSSANIPEVPDVSTTRRFADAPHCLYNDSDKTSRGCSSAVYPGTSYAQATRAHL